MITWLKKLRISAVVDSGKGLSPSFRKTVAGSKELRGFEEKAETLAKSFSDQAASCDPPAGLHDSIMRAVRHACVEQCRGTGAAKTRMPRLVGGLAGFPWRLSAGLAVLLAVCVWWVSQHRMTSPSGQGAVAPLTTAAQALDLGNRIPALPNSLVAPLSDEMARLRLDLTNAVEVVVASLP